MTAPSSRPGGAGPRPASDPATGAPTDTDTDTDTATAGAPNGGAPNGGAPAGTTPNGGAASDDGPARFFWCCELELSGDGGVTAPMPADPAHVRARVLARLHGEPLGLVLTALSADGIDIDATVAAARARFGAQIAAHLAAEGLTDLPGRPPVRGAACPNSPQPGPAVSVLVCTRNRARQLDICLKRLAGIDYPDVEFIIVDNAPADGSTREVIDALAAEDPRFRYVLEPLPGLSRARNRGLAEARGKILACTDDDVSVEPDWVHALIRGFHRQDHVGCVTGLVCTANVTSSAEAYFDTWSAAWTERNEPQLFDLAAHRQDGALYPYAAGIFGTGANFAFDTQMLRDIGGFDEALGAGTKARGGEDLDIFVRVLLAGFVIAYEPAAVTWHHHRADSAALLKQMYSYGTGLSAYVTKLLWQRSTRVQVLRRVPSGITRLVHLGTETSTRAAPQASPPRGATLQQIKGIAVGPVLYLRARRSTASTPVSLG